MRTKIDPKSAREELHLRREELAVKAKVGINTVGACEREKRWPAHAETRRRYLAALGLTEADLEQGARK